MKEKPLCGHCYNECTDECCDKRSIDVLERKLEEAISIAEEALNRVHPISHTGYEIKHELEERLDQLKEKENE